MAQIGLSRQVSMVAAPGHPSYWDKRSKVPKSNENRLKRYTLRKMLILYRDAKLGSHWTYPVWSLLWGDAKAIP